MNGFIACDRHFGNTLRVAEALAEELRAVGHDFTVVDLHSQTLKGPLVTGALESAREFARRFAAEALG
jgi:menaquinone-dependent protoporphyrinogen IX oxidase